MYFFTFWIYLPVSLYPISSQLVADRFAGPHRYCNDLFVKGFHIQRLPSCGRTINGQRLGIRKWWCTILRTVAANREQKWEKVDRRDSVAKRSTLWLRTNGEYEGYQFSWEINEKSTSLKWVAPKAIDWPICHPAQDAVHWTNSMFFTQRYMAPEKNNIKILLFLNFILSQITIAVWLIIEEVVNNSNYSNNENRVHQLMELK